MRKLAFGLIVAASTALVSSSAQAHVTAAFSDDGLDLIIDHQPWNPQTDPIENRIVIQQVQDEIRIFGLPSELSNGDEVPTLVNGRRSVSFPIPRRNLIVQLGQGNNSPPDGADVRLRGLAFVDRGEDIFVAAVQVQMEDCYTFTKDGCDIVVVGGWISMTECWAEGNLSVTGGKTVNSTILIDGGHANDDIDVVGSNEITITDSWAGRRLNVDGSNERDVVTVTDSVAGDAAEFTLHRGSDDLIIENLRSGGPASDPVPLAWLKVELGDGGDYVWPSGCHVISPEMATIDGGRGFDVAWEPPATNPNNFGLNGVTLESIEAVK
ncbi:hypothetical protein Mal4_39010 [Maioricimonas rarisocia]|uniref:Right handed beta helix domain-containing protein n=1 Tax=Maioricimonas rarisocia TaxID=2528026 RepID=A0A517ZAM5_9PLAN|nr:hypothetical protein [Maioricimonas rarisocia]QDU39556.1 hypothetical protein Mal4_39010 [Maioricimonas rarisocia]